MPQMPYCGFNIVYDKETDTFDGIVKTNKILSEIEKHLKETIAVAALKPDERYLSPVYTKDGKITDMAIIFEKKDSDFTINLASTKEKGRIVKINNISESELDVIGSETWKKLGNKIANYVTYDDMFKKPEVRELKIEEKQVDKVNDYLTLCKKLNEIDDGITYGHSMRVGENVSRFLGMIGFNKEECDNYMLGACLHDVGKLFVDKDIINKNGRLSDDERSEMKNHTSKGVEFLKNVDAPKEAVFLAETHHHLINGYPKIDYELNDRQRVVAAVINIVDVYDARINKRQYHEPALSEDIINDLKQDFIRQNLDVRLVNIFELAIKDERFDFTKNSVSIAERKLEGENIVNEEIEKTLNLIKAKQVNDAYLKVKHAFNANLPAEMEAMVDKFSKIMIGKYGPEKILKMDKAEIAETIGNELVNVCTSVSKSNNIKKERSGYER